MIVRLIDADKLTKKWTIASPEPYNTDAVEVLDSIREAPTIDAVLVVHGWWETNSDRPDTLICSVCKCGFDMWKHDPHNYCPNCGVKMDG